VSSDTAALVSRAFAGRRATAGRFDPTLLGTLVGAGYDRSFELLAAGDGGAVALDVGAGFDPGGIGKGLAADLVVEELLAGGAEGACVNLGGDLRAEGAGPWVVDVADPFDSRRPPIASLALDAGGVATSSRLRRAWWQGGHRRHHLIDPSTGRPADTGVAAVTVVTGEAWRAEVLAKAALLAGVEGAMELLATRNAAGLVVDDNGTVHRSDGLGPFLA
jgi:thiamine biosynthesis lipoprotein